MWYISHLFPYLFFEQKIFKRVFGRQNKFVLLRMLFLKIAFLVMTFSWIWNAIKFLVILQFLCLVDTNILKNIVYIFKSRLDCNGGGRLLDGGSLHWQLVAIGIFWSFCLETPFSSHKNVEFLWEEVWMILVAFFFYLLEKNFRPCTKHGNLRFSLYFWAYFYMPPYQMPPGKKPSFIPLFRKYPSINFFPGLKQVWSNFFD